MARENQAVLHAARHALTMPDASYLLDSRILVVDDVPADARFVESILTATGYTCVTTSNDPVGAAALHREQRFDLVILDLMMPGKNGYEVMAELATFEPDSPLPVLVMTADPGELQRALLAGARDFVVKPIRAVELRARVRNLLDMRLALKALERHGEELERALGARSTELRESEELFRLFAENIPEAVWIRDAGQKVFRYGSPQLSAVLGRPVVTGTPFSTALDSIHPEDRSRVEAELKRKPHGGVDLELRFLRPDGSQRRGRVRSFPIGGDGQTPEWVGGILEDVTERRQMEMELREAESRFRALVEQSVAGIYTVEEGLWTYVNPTLCDMLGYAAAELVGRATLDFVVAEDHERLLQNRAKAIAGERETLSATYRFRRKNGETVHLSLGSRDTDANGRLSRLGVALDVTERVRAQALLAQAEEHYRVLVEQSLMGIYIVDKHRLVYANRRLCDLLGYSAEEMGRLSFTDMVHQDDHPTLAKIVERRISGDLGAIVLGCRVRRKDGVLLHLEIESRIIDFAGRKAALGMVQDVTERKRAHAALESANSYLRVLSDRVLAVQEEERRLLSSELHDDVGQSLVALQLGMHRLGELSVQAEPRLLEECVAIVSSVQEKLRQVAVRLHPPQLVQLGLQEALRGLVSRQRATTGLDIRCHLDGPDHGEYPPQVEIACYRICQEALNNATRHSRAGTIEVRTKLEADRFCLSVSDDGNGFDAEARESAAATDHLGLIGMEERARLAGGSLELRTAPGAGTVVIAMFPRPATARLGTARRAAEASAP